MAICSGRKRLLRSFQAWTRTVASWGVRAPSLVATQCTVERSSRPKGTLEALYEVGDPLEALPGGGLVVQEGLGQGEGRRAGFDGPRGALPAVGVAGDKVTGQCAAIHGASFPRRDRRPPWRSRV